MVIIPPMKHNAFREVSIPQASELVAAYGLTRPGSKYSGDEYLDPSASKLDQVKAVAKEAFEED